MTKEISKLCNVLCLLKKPFGKEMTKCMCVHLPFVDTCLFCHILQM